jgi:hypothetical protein
MTEPKKKEKPVKHDQLNATWQYRHRAPIQARYNCTDLPIRDSVSPKDMQYSLKNTPQK